MSKSARILAPAAAAVALAVPAAQGRPAVEAPTHNSAPAASVPAAPARSHGDAFDWDSAAIGAAGGAAGVLALLSVGVAAVWRVRVPSTR